jgi:hypothetical protein
LDTVRLPRNAVVLVRPSTPRRWVDLECDLFLSFGSNDPQNLVTVVEGHEKPDQQGGAALDMFDQFVQPSNAEELRRDL